jgi:putative tryptophan/tyrosine transport system substrate-binding protein
MRRREFIAGLSGTAAWPLVARAQHTMPVIGYLYSGSPGPSAEASQAFRSGLAQAGFIEGKDVNIEYRWAHNDLNRLPALAAELIALNVAVLVASPTGAALAAQAATKTIPVVFGAAGDPVERGLVKSISRPEANLTGIIFLGPEVDAKRLELLHELLPKITTIATLINPDGFTMKPLQNVEAAARAIGVQLVIVKARSEDEFNSAFETAKQKRAGALLVISHGLFINSRKKLIELTKKFGLPSIYEWRELSQEGGLISYGTNINDMFRIMGTYAGRILKGAEPSDLPVVQPTNFELVINLKTAKALGLTVPPQLLARADEVIE